jgi:hypothetical protein
MTELDDPREQLRVIRSLMERATIYRALSAPTALIGGLLSLGAFATAYYAKHIRHANLTPRQFLVVWLVVLALTGMSNAIVLWRGAVGRGERFFSPGMKTALASVAPAFLIAGFLTCVVHRPIDLCILWIVLYGLALLATQHFAPRSLVVLGAAFFVTGCVLVVTWKHLFLAPGQVQPTTLVVSGIMAAVFGGVHLAYAAAVWALGEERAVETSPDSAHPAVRSTHV